MTQIWFLCRPVRLFPSYFKTPERWHAWLYHRAWCVDLAVMLSMLREEVVLMLPYQEPAFRAWNGQKTWSSLRSTAVLLLLNAGRLQQTVTSQIWQNSYLREFKVFSLFQSTVLWNWPKSQYYNNMTCRTMGIALYYHSLYLFFTYFYGHHSSVSKAFLAVWILVHPDLHEWDVIIRLHDVCFVTSYHPVLVSVSRKGEVHISRDGSHMVSIPESSLYIRYRSHQITT